MLQATSSLAYRVSIKDEFRTALLHSHSLRFPYGYIGDFLNID